PRPKGVELLRLIHTLHERSFAGRVRKAAEVAAQPLPRRNELTLLAFLNSPDTYRVDLVGHLSCSLLSRHRRGSAAHRLPVWYEHRGVRESLLAALYGPAVQAQSGCLDSRHLSRHPDIMSKDLSAWETWDQLIHRRDTNPLEVLRAASQFQRYFDAVQGA